MNTDLEILTEAKNLICDKKNWTTGELARDVRGAPVFYASEEAVCFCSYGALYHVAATRGLIRNDLYRATQLLVNSAHKIQRLEGIVFVNDHLGHEKVMDMYNMAIEEAKQG